MKAYLDEIDSPVGTVAFATDEEGALLGLRFREGRRPASLEKGLKREGFALSRDEERTAAAREQLVEYFAGERRSFDLPIARRVIGVEGSLKGYADGMSLKERLLNFEASQKPLFA